ncbi:MAG TPA: hypothetical protein VNI02_14015 [Blastocatellia bacterium]|jgi:uncharacterized protein YaiE (UPF0345 family)|nr:hypothetical protein [Blastocatellia bacterium]
MATRFPAVALLTLALMTGLSPNAARADGEGANADRPIRLYASERFGPIGAIKENSPGGSAVVIDGRAFGGAQMIWGGELIEAPSDRSLCVSFDSIGQVVLDRGTMVRFGTARADTDDAARHVLVASLVNGGLRVKLGRDAGAYVEAAGSSFTASPNARFRVNVSGGLASVETIAGTVAIEQQPAGQRRYVLRPVAGQGATLSVAARSTRQVQIQVTDENDRPIPDLPLLFSLGSPCLGSLGIGAGAGTLFKEKTDKRGIAAVPWVASAIRCKGAITVKVEGTEDSYTYQAEVTQAGFWTARNSLLVGAAAGAGIGIAVVKGGGNKEPITPVPPPQVRP